MNKRLRIGILLACCLSLQGCLVASAVDLAATTVVTAGKIAVKGTGAVINAAIPDKEKKDKKESENTSPPPTGTINAREYQPIPEAGSNNFSDKH
ncbi:MAG: NF038104 family lipoprotein [Neisseria sp.]|uniref:NF038104 family lipoprotein n=1 Tax=Neisseria sp. TaxID=192066 RepID=UPI0026DADBE3|nr:NF038104 family lipoprotein [Neisseria sp.]MDO4641089.1 NF038104 family lipoprotein [Neisseria sp.]